MSWRTQDDDSIGGFCLKLKLTDSPGIAGGFYWIYQQKAGILTLEKIPAFLCFHDFAVPAQAKQCFLNKNLLLN